MTCAWCDAPLRNGDWVWCRLPARALRDCTAVRSGLEPGRVRAYCRDCHRRYHDATRRLRTGMPGDTVEVDEIWSMTDDEFETWRERLR